MNVKAMSAEDLKWRRRSDARTLAEAQEILNDKERHAEAIAEAREMVMEENKRFNAMKKVAGTKVEGSAKKSVSNVSNEGFYNSIKNARK